MSRSHVRLGIGLFSAHICLGGLAPASYANPVEPGFKAVARSGRHTIRPVPKRAPSVVGETNDFVAMTLTPEDVRKSQGLFLRSREGDGGGGDLVQFTIVQRLYLDSQCTEAENAFPTQCGGPCNVVLMLWQETTENPDGIDIIVDGAKLGTLPGVPAAQLPALNGVNVIVRSGPGVHTFRAEAVNTADFAEATIDVLDGQPFAETRTASLPGRSGH